MIPTRTEIGGRVYERDTDRLFIQLFRGRPDAVEALARAALRARPERVERLGHS